MSFDKKQFRELIESTLKDFGLYSESAVNLLLGTAAQESAFGTYLRQLGGGPALGIFQMEPATFIWIRNHYISKYFEGLADVEPEDLIWNLRLAILMARLRYRIVPEALPKADDILGLAKYWKKYYNTKSGKGTIEEFINNYHKFIT